MTAAFHLSGTIRWVNGATRRPLSPPANRDSLSPEEQAKLDEWDDMNSRANALIYNSLSQQYRSTNYFNFTKTAADNFAHLKNFIKTQALSHGASLRRQLEDSKMDSGESIEDYYNRWLLLHNKYQEATGSSIRDLRQVELFLQGITNDHYNPAIAKFSISETIRNPLNLSERIPNLLTLAIVLEDLQDFDVTTRYSVRSPDDQVNYSQESQSRSGSSSMPSASNGSSSRYRVPGDFDLNKLCENCGGYGHVSNQCCSPIRRRGVSVPPHLRTGSYRSNENNNGQQQQDQRSKGKGPRKPHRPAFPQRDDSNYTDDGWDDSSYIIYDECGFTQATEPLPVLLDGGV